MLHYQYIVFLLVGMVIQTFAQQTWVPFLQQTKTAPTVNVASSNNNNVSFSIQINGMFAIDKKVEDVVYKYISIPDGELMMEEGSPQLPIITKLIAIPDCDDISFSAVPSNKIELANYYVTPAPKHEKKKWEDGSYECEEVFEENKNIYSANTYFPGKYAEIIEVGYVRDQKVARVAIYPIQFNPISKTINAYTDFNINLSFVNPSSPVNKELGIFRNMMHNTSINYELKGISASTNIQSDSLGKITAGSVTRVTNLNLLVGANALPVDYLIITHSSLYNSSYLTTLANHRKDFNGYDVVICQVDANGSNNDIYDFEDIPGHIKYPSLPTTRYVSVRDFVRDVFLNGRASHTGDGHLGYLLLVGDALRDDNLSVMVPAEYYYTGYAQAGDYYYACTGGDSDDLLDLMYGRLPVGNETALNNNVNKIISYEYNSNGSWCNDYTFVAASYDLFGLADPTIRQLTAIVPPTYSKSYGYRALNTAPPTQVTEANPIFGQVFTQTQYDDPANLCGSRLLNDWLYDNPVAGINNRIHTVIYEGHGSWRGLGGEGCGRQIFKVEDCLSPFTNTVNNRLNNDLYSFMIFIACETGHFDTLVQGDCVSEVVANLGNRGSIGILSSTRISYASAFGVVDAGVLNAMYGSFSHVMGEAIMESKLGLTSLLFRRQYNLYGDPAVNLWPTGYTISENVTLSGTVDVSKNISVASGVTLTILPGTTLRFANNTQLIVNGTLAANGTSNNRITFTGQSKGSWNGIQLNSTGSVLTCCNIRNAVTAVSINNVNPTIQQCFIDDAANYGIYVNGSSAIPIITHNYIEADVACIFHYNNGNGYITNNSFRNAYYGVFVQSGSPRYDYYNIGRNKFESTITRDKVMVTGGQPWMGMYQYFTIPGSGYKYIYNSGVSTINANYNYWTAYPPSYTYFSGPVVRDYPQQNPPSNPPAGPSWTLPKGSGSDFFLAFDEASKLFYEGKYTEARESFKILTQQYLDSEYSSYSLNWYMLASEQLKELGKQEDYLKSVRQNKSAHLNTKFYALKWLLQLEMRNGTTTKAMNMASEVEIGSVYDWELSLDLAAGLFEYKGDIQEAEKILNRLSEKFNDSNSLEAIEFIRNHMNSQSYDGKSYGKIQAEAEIPDKYKLLDNYPNPFNPNTTIQYQIATLPNLSEKETFVSLKIYDILGREVTTLVNEMKKPGYYTVTFEASDLASGIFIYRLQADNFICSKKMLLLK